MALAVTTIMEINASATTTGNLSGGGFNPANANMLADLTTDTNTANTNSPVVSSASYNFAAGDVGHWVYIKSGTNWTPGWYKIASVAANKATLDGTIGTAVQVDTTKGNPSPRYLANTVAGCATVGTPTSGTFTIDYSQGLAHIKTNTDLTCTAASTTITATTGFTPVMVGNLIHLTALTGTGAIVGWYEIVSYTSATQVVLDRTPTNGANDITAGTFYVGGALSLNSTLDDDAFEIALATNGVGAFRYFLKGSLTAGEGISIVATGATQNPIVIEGYGTLRGDIPTGSSRPTINNSSSTTTTLAQNWDIYNCISVATNSGVNSSLNNGTNGKVVNCKVVAAHTGANKAGLTLLGDALAFNCEAICYRGNAFSIASSAAKIVACYAHDSNVGVAWAGANSIFNMMNTIIADNVSTAFLGSGASANNSVISNCTFFGAANKLGTGLSFLTGSTDYKLINCIIYGFTTGVTHADAQNVGFDDYNAYYNNTTDVTNWQKGVNTIALDPGFTDVTQITGTGATSSTNVLTGASGTPFSTCEANVDFVYLVSGSGTGFTAGKYLITAVNAGGANVTVSSNITSSGSGSSIVWQVTTGHDFTVGTNMRAAAFPGTFPGL